MQTFLGLLLLVTAAVTYVFIWKIGRHFDRAAFNRRNSNGNEVFDDYDQKERFRIKEAGGRLLMTVLIFAVFVPAIFGGLFLLVAPNIW